MLTFLQKAAAKAIVNVFETGSAVGKYDQVTLLAGDPGHLTYGRSQTTLASGNLFLLIKAYCAEPDASLAVELGAFLQSLANKDYSLDHNMPLRALLKQAGRDPVMQSVQDRFFDRVYWDPSDRAAADLGIDTPLGRAVVYDSHIHGSWSRIRNSTTASFGTPGAIGEKTWIGRYVDVRRNWLANHSKPILRKTVYRMNSFRVLIGSGNWDLALPITVRGVLLDESSLEESPGRVSAQDVEVRLLMLRTPYMRGSDVTKLQQALVAKGLDATVDGVFGPKTEVRVEEFQQSAGLVADGIVGPATRSALGM